MQKTKSNILHPIRCLFKKNPDKLLKKLTGVVHVGANTGQEIQLYAKYGLSVVWIEPIPEVFDSLQDNLRGITKQIALRGLVTDIDNAEYNFNIASNNGASSSILDLNLHQDIWPEVTYKNSINLRSKTLSSLLKDNNINIAEYDMLVMDTQGSELLVLKGAIPILQNFTYIKTEVPDFESYKGCCQLKDLQLFLTQHGFAEFSRHKFATHPNGGNYYDIIYKKR
jgi:FkbM family methyltransferase